VKLKYKNNTYDSEDIPLFLYFKNYEHKKKFATVLLNYKVGEYVVAPHVYVALAGSAVIKDKRTKLYYCIDSREEKNTIVKSMFEDDQTENNAMVCSPPDIPEESLIQWIQNNLPNLK
jgi:hypothetical protein